MSVADPVETLWAARQALRQRLAEVPEIERVVAALQARQGASLDGVWGSSCALVASSLAMAAPGPVLVVAPFLDDLDMLADELALFAGCSPDTHMSQRHETVVFPAWEVPPRDVDPLDHVFAERLRILKQIAAGTGPRPIIATSIQALQQPTPSRELVEQSTRTLRVGDEVNLDELLAWLVERGLRNMPAVELPGEFSQRGGLLDLFAPDWREPVRLEFFGESIESIRRFDVNSQRSLAPLDAVDVTVLPADVASDCHPLQHFPEQTWVVLLEPQEVTEQGRRWLQKLTHRKGLYTVESTLKRILERPTATLAQLSGGAFETAAHVPTESVERFQGDAARLNEMLGKIDAEEDIYLVCATDGEAERLTADLEPLLAARPHRVHFPRGRLRAGFRLLRPPVTILSGSELLGRREAPHPAGRRALGRSIDSFLDLKEGDYIVHLSYGIGRYEGMRLLEKDRQREEHLEVEFHGGTKIYVPATKIDLVQKYVGGHKTAPPLAKIGGKLWARRKEQALEAVQDMAAEMLDLQAARSARPGIKYASDSVWQKQFEGNFPYTETPDQLTSLAAIKQDMESPKVMDRLICGEVGYGKTELAMRAAFKAVDSGYQVAILVPTTILAEQHYRTFCKRMEGFPFSIGVLSRFRTKAEQTQLLKGLAAGSVDMVIGTHRLVSPDVQFSNLGLVIVDEEQRFGVEAKEQLKVMRNVVDVLTLTATPIPRTLHLSLLGIRDISNLETPPANRLAVETRVTRWDPALVEYAIRRELGRGGQIFFVHNRIHDLDDVAQRIRDIVPEVTIGIAHGQMDEDELSHVMLDFVEHKFDLLLATTIVESGLDIPTANTMFIDDADQFGLAEMHQLRGRVGRYKHRAYCYLLVNRNRALGPDAARRLRAIEEFSSIGAGFGIAMRDLEIRGAGNILGTEQSGHISAVGYELYCQLLEKSVRSLKKLPAQERVEVNLDLPGEAYLPRNYIPDMRMKIDLYRRMSRVTSEPDLEVLVAEMMDRFGRPPDVVDRLVQQARLRIWAHQHQLTSIHLENEFAVLKYKNKNKIAELVLVSQGRLRVVDKISAYLPLGDAHLPLGKLYGELEALLRPR